jgi:multicomponent Na+:H+ antiporter subunit G
LNSDFISLLSAFLLVAGALFSLIASLGLLRFPDLFCRMHAASKAGTAGSGLILIAAALHAGDWAIWLKCLAAILFFLLTAPLAAHLLAKAALAAGLKSGFFGPDGDA